jgi:ABC-type oligopeptide transport system substrate-binding subunit
MKHALRFASALALLALAAPALPCEGHKTTTAGKDAAKPAVATAAKPADKKAAQQKAKTAPKPASSAAN